MLHVRHALERLGKGWRLIEPKSEESRRTIRLPAPVVPILRAHRIRQLERRLAAGARWHEHEFVFTTRTGQPLDGCRLNRQTKTLLEKAGLPRLKFHSLRHSCASFLLVQGVAPRVVMEILGHSQISLTLNTYVRWVSLPGSGSAPRGGLTANSRRTRRIASLCGAYGSPRRRGRCRSSERDRLPRDGVPRAAVGNVMVSHGRV